MESIKEFGKDVIYDFVIEWVKFNVDFCGESLRDVRIRVDINWGGRRCVVVFLE